MNVLRQLTSRTLLMIAFTIGLTAFIVHAYWLKVNINELWFDEGFNYYYAAKNAPAWWKVLTTDDSGYLNNLPRVISLILVRVLHVQYYFPTFFKIANIACFSFMMSLLLSHQFDPYLGKNLMVRSTLLLLLALYPHSDFAFPFNSSYGAIIPLLYVTICLFSKRPFTRLEFTVWFLAFPFILISKIPLALLGLLIFSYAILKNIFQYGKVTLSLWGLVCCFTQIIYFYYYFKDVYFLDKSKPINVATLVSTLAISDSLAGLSVFGYLFKLVHDNHHILFMSLTLLMGVIFLVLTLYQMVKLFQKKQFQQLEIMTVALAMLGITALLIYMNRAYGYAWDTLYIINRYLYHRHIWLGFVSVLFILVMLMENGFKFKRALRIYFFVIASGSFIFFQHINKYEVSKPTVNAAWDQRGCDWEQMNRVPILTKVIIANAYGAPGVAPVTAPALGAWFILTTLVPVTFSQPTKITLPIHYSGDNLLLTVKIDGQPADAKNIQVTLVLKDNSNLILQPLYPAIHSRYLYFDLGAHTDPQAFKRLTVTSSGTIAKGWYDFIIYKDSFAPATVIQKAVQGG